MHSIILNLFEMAKGLQMKSLWLGIREGKKLEFSSTIIG